MLRSDVRISLTKPEIIRLSVWFQCEILNGDRKRSSMREQFQKGNHSMQYVSHLEGGDILLQRCNLVVELLNLTHLCGVGVCQGRLPRPSLLQLVLLLSVDLLQFAKYKSSNATSKRNQAKEGC